MSKMPKAFKRKDHGSKGGFTVPGGEYVAKIVESSYDQNKNKDGHYLLLTFELQNKKVKGKKLKVWLNLDHPNETAVEMANNELGSICDAVGVDNFKDSEALHGKPMILKVRETEGDKNNPPSNVIDMYINMKDAEGVVDEEDDKPKKGKKGKKKKDKKKKISVDEVKDLARDYKKETSAKKLNKLLDEYDIEKMSEIKDLKEDDLESLYEDLQEELED